MNSTTNPYNNYYKNTFEGFIQEIEESSKLTTNQLDTIYKEVNEKRERTRCNPEDIDCIGFNKLHWAAITNQSKDIRLLIEEHHISVDLFSTPSQSYKHQMTPLYLAAKQGHEAAVNCLLSCNADCNTESRIYSSFIGEIGNYHNVRAFEAAALSEQYGVVSLLGLQEIEYYKTHLKTCRSELENPFFGYIGTYINSDKLDGIKIKLEAVETLENAIKTKATSKKLAGLSVLKPALKDKSDVKLKQIFDACFAARRHEENKEIDDDCSCTIL